MTSPVIANDGRERMRVSGWAALSLAAAFLASSCVSGSTPSGPPRSSRTASAPPVSVVNPAVGGVVLPTNVTITAGIGKAAPLATLNKAVIAANMGSTLSGPGPFTLFAPTDEAFGRMAPGVVDRLLRPENKKTLSRFLSYHLVPGLITATQLVERVKAGGGTARLNTVEGDPLTVSLTSDVLTLTDINGNKSYVEVADVRQSNGVIQVVNGVLVPKI